MFFMGRGGGGRMGGGGGIGSKGGAISDQGCMKFIVSCFSNSPMRWLVLMLTVTESNIDAGLG